MRVRPCVPTSPPAIGAGGIEEMERCPSSSPCAKDLTITPPLDQMFASQPNRTQKNLFLSAHPRFKSVTRNRGFGNSKARPPLKESFAPISLKVRIIPFICRIHHYLIPGYKNHSIGQTENVKGSTQVQVMHTTALEDRNKPLLASVECHQTILCHSHAKGSSRGTLQWWGHR